MRKRDIDRFRKMLTEMRDELVRRSQNASISEVHQSPDDSPDSIDVASSESSMAFQGHLRDREHGLLAKVEEALLKIDQGVYGECEDCGEQIALGRLRARPVAELCIDCKSEQEKLERRG